MSDFTLQIRQLGILILVLFFVWSMGDIFALNIPNDSMIAGLARIAPSTRTEADYKSTLDKAVQHVINTDPGIRAAVNMLQVQSNRYDTPSYFNISPYSTMNPSPSFDQPGVECCTELRATINGMLLKDPAVKAAAQDYQNYEISTYGSITITDTKNAPIPDIYNPFESPALFPDINNPDLSYNYFKSYIRNLFTVKKPTTINMGANGTNNAAKSSPGSNDGLSGSKSEPKGIQGSNGIKSTAPAPGSGKPNSIGTMGIGPKKSKSPTGTVNSAPVDTKTDKSGGNAGGANSNSNPGGGTTAPGSSGNGGLNNGFGSSASDGPY